MPPPWGVLWPRCPRAGRAVAPTAIGLRVVIHEPFGKPFAPTTVFSIAPTPFDERGLRVCTANQRIGNGDRANRVIGEPGLRVKQRGEILAAVVFEFVDRADDVANDCAEHVYCPNFSRQIRRPALTPWEVGAFAASVWQES